MDTITQQERETGDTDDMVLLQASIPEDLHKRIRRVVAETRGATIKSVVTEILEKALPPNSASNDTQGE